MGFAESLRPLVGTRFRCFVAARAVSMLGSAMASVALAFAVLDLTGSSSDLGLVLAANQVPMVVFVLVGGVIADRLPRHTVLVASNAVAFAGQGTVAVLLLSGHATVGGLIVIEAVEGAATAFTFPAMQGVIPQVVPAGQLQQANALLSLTRNIVRIGGPALGGVVVVTAGSGWAIAADALSFGIAALLFARLHLPAAERIHAANMLAELGEGWQEFTAHTWVWVIVCGAGLLNAIQAGLMYTLGPVIADDTIGRPAWGVVLGASGIGAILGTVWLLRVRLRYPLRTGVLGILAIAPLLAALGLAPHTLLLVVLAIVMGAGLEAFSISWDTAMQQHIPVDKLSRVASYDAVGSFVMIPVGMVAAGPLADAFGTREVTMVGAGVFTLGTLAMFAVPSVRNLPAVTEDDALTAAD